MQNKNFAFYNLGPSFWGMVFGQSGKVESFKREINSMFGNCFQKQSSILQRKKKGGGKVCLTIRKYLLIVFTCFFMIILKNNYTNM